MDSTIRPYRIPKLLLAIFLTVSSLFWTVESGAQALSCRALVTSAFLVKSDGFRYNSVDAWTGAYQNFVSKQGKAPREFDVLINTINRRLHVITKDKASDHQLRKDVETTLEVTRKMLRDGYTQAELLRTVDEAAAHYTRYNVQFLGERVNHPQLDPGKVHYFSDVNGRHLVGMSEVIKAREHLKLEPSRYFQVPTTKNLSEFDFVRTFHVPVFFYGLSFKPVNPADGTVYSTGGYIRHDANHNETMIIANAKRGYDIADPRLIRDRARWYPSLIKKLESCSDLQVRNNIVSMIFNTVHEMYFPIEYVFAVESLSVGQASWRLSGPEGYMSIAQINSRGEKAAKALHDRSVLWIKNFFDENPEAYRVLRNTIERRGYSW